MSLFLDQIKKGLGFGVGLVAIFALLIGGLSWAQTLNEFSAGDVISAAQVNANFTALKNETIKKPPIGSIVAWHKSMSGTPGLPDGWVECNGQVLADSASLYDGQTIPDLNTPANGWSTKGSFLRGDSASGIFENDQMQGHKHDDLGHRHGVQMWGGTEDIFGAFDRLVHSRWRDPGGVWNSMLGSADLTNPTDSGHGTPRIGNETRPTNMSVVWIMRVK